MANKYSSKTEQIAQQLRKLLPIIILVCGGTFISGQVKKSQRDISSKVYETFETDGEMDQAIEMAKTTFDEFEKAIASNLPNYSKFTLKKAFPSDFGDEHVWVMDVLKHPSKPVYVGIIGSVPQYTRQVKLNDIVEISKEEVSDWFFYDNDVLHGAFTTKLLRSRMNEVERNDFDKVTNNAFREVK